MTTLKRIFSPGACCTPPSPADSPFHWKKISVEDITSERFPSHYRPWGSFESPFFKVDTNYSESALRPTPADLEPLKALTKQKITTTPGKSQQDANEAINKTLDLITAIEEKAVPEEFPSKEMLCLCMKQWNLLSRKTEEPTLNLITTSLLPQAYARSAINIDKKLVGQLAQHFTSGNHPPFIIEIHAGSGLLASELHKRNINIIATDACFSHFVHTRNLHTVYFSIDTDAFIFFKEQTRSLDNHGIEYNPYILCAAPGGDIQRLTHAILKMMEEIENLKIIMIGIEQLNDDIGETKSSKIVKKYLTHKFGYQQIAPIDRIYEYQKRQ